MFHNLAGDDQVSYLILYDEVWILCNNGYSELVTNIHVTTYTCTCTYIFWTTAHSICLSSQSFDSMIMSTLCQCTLYMYNTTCTCTLPHVLYMYTALCTCRSRDRKVEWCCITVNTLSTHMYMYITCTTTVVLSDCTLKVSRKRLKWLTWNVVMLH